MTRRTGAVAALLCASVFALRYPGEISFDAAKQLAQAISGRYDDWHPPIMAAWWSVLRRMTPAGLAMLAFQLTIHWLGVALIADGLARSGRRRTAWVMLASGASPLLLCYYGRVPPRVRSAAAAGIARPRRHRQPVGGRDRASSDRVREAPARGFQRIAELVRARAAMTLRAFDASCGISDPRTGRMIMTPDSSAFIRRDYLKKPFPVWPSTWLALGLCLAALLWSKPAGFGARMSRPLLMSGLIYAVAYAVVGVAGDIRYFFWPIVAFQTVLIVGWSDIGPRLRRPDAVSLACGGVLLVVIAIGYVARFTDDASLLLG